VNFKGVALTSQLTRAAPVFAVPTVRPSCDGLLVPAINNASSVSTPFSTKTGPEPVPFAELKNIVLTDKIRTRQIRFWPLSLPDDAKVLGAQVSTSKFSLTPRQ